MHRVIRFAAGLNSAAMRRFDQPPKAAGANRLAARHDEPQCRATNRHCVLSQAIRPQDDGISDYCTLDRLNPRLPPHYRGPGLSSRLQSVAPSHPIASSRWASPTIASAISRCSTDALCPGCRPPAACPRCSNQPLRLLRRTAPVQRHSGYHPMRSLQLLSKPNQVLVPLAA